MLLQQQQNGGAVTTNNTAKDFKTISNCPAQGLVGWMLGVHARLRLLHLLFVGLHCPHPSVHPSAPAASHRVNLADA
jgi:hypothetical protein